MEKATQPAKADFDLHVLLIMKTDGLPKSKATFKAWLEGEAGLKKRLTPKVG